MFDPKKILRQVSIPLLQEFFRQRGELQDLPWEELKEKRRVDQICDAWQQLPDDGRPGSSTTLAETLSNEDIDRRTGGTSKTIFEVIEDRDAWQRGGKVLTANGTGAAPTAIPSRTADRTGRGPRRVRTFGVRPH